tara:strand:- start:42 stop:566 length:525 start_codon:yes stop_codon:yes gene_type:complete
MEEIIDKYLDLLISIDLNKVSIPIEQEMEDPNQKKDEEWKTWIPITSQVKTAEIVAFESLIGKELPDSFKRFLKHKHFYELQIGECVFCEHPVNIWRKSLSTMIFEGYPREFLIDKGRIPFANWSDWGLLCFDTTLKTEGNNYPIVLWDHELQDKFEVVYDDFLSMLLELDKKS